MARPEREASVSSLAVCALSDLRPFGQRVCTALDRILPQRIANPVPGPNTLATSRTTPIYRRGIASCPAAAVGGMRSSGAGVGSDARSRTSPETTCSSSSLARAPDQVAAPFTLGLYSLPFGGPSPYEQASLRASFGENV